MAQNDLNGIAKKIKKVLLGQREAVFAYVFGSTATGTARKGSDVDVAVYLDPGERRRFFDIRLELLEKVTRAIADQADILVLNTAAPFLKYVVLKEGKLVFERDPEARLDFELKALNEYFDYKPILKQYHNRLRASV